MLYQLMKSSWTNMFSYELKKMYRAIQSWQGNALVWRVLWSGINPVAPTTTIRVRNGKCGVLLRMARLVKTKEQLGGYHLTTDVLPGDEAPTWVSKDL
jgi:hypothetical protein